MYFQAILYHEQASTWVPYLVSAVQQVILIALCVYIRIKKRLKAKKLNSVVERNPLLINGVPADYDPDFSSASSSSLNSAEYCDMVAPQAAAFPAGLQAPPPSPAQA